MSKTPNFDSKIQSLIFNLQPGERTCAITGEKWEMTQKEIDLYRRFNVPPRTVATNTLWKWMAYYDAGYQFWWNKHPETGKPVLSFHHPASGVKVLPDAEWHAQDFSAITINADPSRPFFEQLRALQVQVPLLATFSRVEPENSITLFSFGDRNSYFTFACTSERTFFATGAFEARGSSLLFTAHQTTDSHHVLKSQRIFRCRYVRESVDCIYSAFLFDCRNCQNCFGASNKRNRQYVFMNEQLTKEEYERRIGEIDLSKRSVVEKWSAAFDELLARDGVWPENFNVNCQDSTGEYLANAVRCDTCFDSADAPSDQYHTCWSYGVNSNNAFMWGSVDSMDGYMVVSCPNSNRTKFSYRSFRLDECEYCFMCADLRDCFGCIGLKKKRFCIFNKQYNEAEYYQLVDEIKCAMLERGEYGQFFPTSMATTFVPESGAVIYCGATSEELVKLGGQTFGAEDMGATGADRIDPSQARRREDIPDAIDDLGDDWIGVPIYDEVSGRTFAFLKPEIEHYRRLRIAPPSTHFIRRMHEVSAAGQLACLVGTSCAQCGANFICAKNGCYPNRRIFCKSCYTKFIEQHG